LKSRRTQCDGRALLSLAISVIRPVLFRPYSVTAASEGVFTRATTSHVIGAKWPSLFKQLPTYWTRRRNFSQLWWVGEGVPGNFLAA
jgi:hypothetical protein